MMDPKKMRHHTGKGAKGMTHAYAKGGAIGPSKQGGGKSRENPYPKDDPSTDPTRQAYIGTPQLDEMRSRPGAQPDEMRRGADGKSRHDAREDGQNGYPKDDPSTDPTRHAYIGTPQLDEMRRADGYRDSPDRGGDSKERHFSKGGRVMKGRRC